MASAESSEDDVDEESAKEYLNMTVSFDHNMIDAAPAARFTERFKELIESGYGLTVDEERRSVNPELARHPAGPSTLSRDMRF